MPANNNDKENVSRNLCPSRRNFLKNTSMGAVGVIASGAIGTVVAKRTGSVNPGINDNLVVNCNDSSMITGSYDGNPSIQFSRINAAQIKANMDEMVKTLAGKSTAAEAWATIFRKPSSKTWSNVTVAIKVNCIENSMYVKPPIIGKVCESLISLGVSASNICLYDGGYYTNEATAYQPYIGSGGIPSGVVCLNRDSSQGVGTSRDIMVNCAINKGHGSNHGGFTLCMKNHTGTFQFSCPTSPSQMVEWAQNVMAGDPPRQQLCIIDSLWAAVDGPNASATHQPNCISMSTFAPAIDYLVAKKIRSEVMECSVNWSATDTFLGGFGYSSSDPQWVEVSPAGTTQKVATPTIAPSENAFSTSVSITLACTTSGATIRYTTNGSTPMSSSSQYSQAINITQTTTIKAIAYANGMDPSDVATAEYTKVTMRNPDNPASTAAGLKYSYYEIEAELALCTDMLALTPVSTGTKTSFDSSWVTRPEYYALAFEGFINITSAGVYSFYTNSDDGTVLFIGDTKVVDNEGGHAMVEKSGAIGLNAGKHAIKVLYWQGYGGQGLEVSYSSSTISKQLIPASVLFRAPTATGITRRSEDRLSGIISARQTGPGQLAVTVNRKGDYTCSIIRLDGIIIEKSNGRDYKTFVFNKGLSNGKYIIKVTTPHSYEVDQIVMLD